jgi:hypothetical protein
MLSTFLSLFYVVCIKQFKSKSELEKPVAKSDTEVAQTIENIDRDLE